MDMLQQVFEGQEIRATGRDGEFWFVASDVAKLLGYRDAANLVRRLDEDEKGTHSVSTPGGSQELSVVNESGLYAAILGSKREGAKPFRRWVTHDLLPTLRRTGFYSTRQAVITAAGIARAYSRPVTSIPIWLQEYGLDPVGYAENPDNGKPAHVYDMREVEKAFSEGHRYGFTGLRAYSGAWTPGKIPPELMPLSLKEKNRRFREAREAEEVKRLDALHGQTA
ncbi:BRO-N domain-containing protein [Deinococcus arenicola]|uniref:Bro-N domain-containing protein n=1 Tax=Deinococcus arenicola TaxID=2994950 RepID=A0ABU4DUW5_9DEIO|nr:Bro-N domain-containing protein [Deinococcus sp. ZS9-10]MDV6376233.1 Bro-N domain-containing protein [Deinococcus sp. ZS9-10]